MIKVSFSLVLTILLVFIAILVLGSSADNVEIAIKDSGPGIPEQEQSHIFERHRKASSTGKYSSGEDLGLAIVKKILEIHNSTIKVISKPDQGTTF